MSAIKTFVTFTVGAVAGAAVSYFVTSRYEKKIAQEAMDRRMKTFFNLKKEGENENSEKSGEENLENNPEILPENEEESEPVEGSDKKEFKQHKVETAELFKEHGYSGPKYFDYSNIKTKHDPQTDEGNSDEPDEYDMELVNNSGQSNTSDVIELIDKEQFGNEYDEYDNDFMNYYVSEDVLECDGLIIHPDEYHGYIGTVLDKLTGDEDIIYLRNHRLKSDIEIVFEYNEKSGLIN